MPLFATLQVTRITGHSSPQLLEALGALRERATVQQVLAYRDMERRWAAPRDAVREERMRREVEGQPAE